MTSTGRIISGFFAANAAGAAVMVTWFVAWLEMEAEVRDATYEIPLVFAGLLALAWFISSFMSVVPFTIAFWFGRRMDWLGLPYALASGAVIAESILQSTTRWNLDPLARDIGQSLGMNTLAIVAGLAGGAVFWRIIRPRVGPSQT